MREKGFRRYAVLGLRVKTDGHLGAQQAALYLTFLGTKISEARRLRLNEPSFSLANVGHFRPVVAALDLYLFADAFVLWKRLSAPSLVNPLVQAQRILQLIPHTCPMFLQW